MEKNKEILINTLVGQKIRESLVSEMKNHLNDNMDKFMEDLVYSIKKEGLREEVLADLISTLDLSDVIYKTIKNELEKEDIELI